MVKFQKYFFLVFAFLIGSVAPLYGNALNFLLLAFLAILLLMNGKDILRDIRQEKEYIWVNVSFLIYFSLHTLIVLLKGNPIATPSYGTFEVLILNFILIPIYVSTFKHWLTPELLKLFLIAFCAGCLTINLYIAYDTVKSTLFTDPQTALHQLYSTRFGGNKFSLLGGNLYLEPQTLHIVLSALISYFMIFINRNKKIKILTGLMFLLFSIFLSFTVTKSGIIAFFIGFIITNIYILKHRLLKVYLITPISCLLLIVGVMFTSDSLSDKYVERTTEIKQEVKNVTHGIYVGGTIAPRVGFIRESFIHLNEFCIWGLGIYSKNRIHFWLQNSEAQLSQFTNVHNSFIHYWIQGGVFGLGLILFLFLAPFYRMIKHKKFSWLIFSLVTAIFIMNNTCILLALQNSRFMILLLLSMFYCYSDIFSATEHTSINKSISTNMQAF